MTRYFRSLAAAAIAGVTLLGACGAQAMVVTFTGGTSGTDPLGNTWTASNLFSPAWGEPGLGNGTEFFNTAGDMSPDGNSFATAFGFDLGAGAGNIVSPSTGCGGFTFDTRFCDATTGVAFVPTISASGDEVVFNAPTGEQISAGDAFYMNVDFDSAVNFDTFSFSGTWSDTPLSTSAVPEPSSLPMLLAGLAAIGGALYLARKKVMPT